MTTKSKLSKGIIAFITIFSMLLTFAELPFTTVKVLAATIWDGKTTSAPTQGDGSVDNPYQISTAGQLAWFAAQVNGGNGLINVKLTEDIALNENGTTNEWIPIGYSSSKPYGGTFDGGSHIIEGIYIRGSYDNTGLFGYVKSGMVKNIGLFNTDILVSTNFVGGVCGYNNASAISNSYNTGTINGNYSVGGVCGENDGKGSITNCYNIGTVSGSRNSVGGVCGENKNNSSITNCNNTGIISGRGFYVGGVCGYNSSSTISESYNTATVSGTDEVGGVCGVNYISGKITNCYSSGKIIGRNDVGGVCGDNYLGVISNCYNTGTVQSSNGSNYVGGVCGNNQGSITNSYYLGTNEIDSEAGTTYKSSAQFISGEVAYLLQQGQSDIAVQTWGQTCGIGIPNLTTDSTKKVYKDYYTNSCSYFYSNTNTNILAQHTYNNGICSACGSYEPAVANGDVYEISNAGQLYWFAQQVNEEGNTNIQGKLTQDIIIPSQKEWIPIGYSSNKPYGGTFDGGGHTIKGIYIRKSYDYTGLFGCVSYGTLKNIGLINTDILVSTDSVGSVCGGNVSSTITNCYNTGTVYGNNKIGGVCGENYENSAIINCYNTGTVSGSGNYVGGLCGDNAGKDMRISCYNTIINCHNTGTISGNDGVGGVCGGSWYDNNIGTTANCYNTGKISGRNSVGGVSGGYSGKINSCYNTGTVSSSGGNVGGVCGVDLGSIANSYYLEASETDSVAGTTYKTSAQFTSGEVAYLLQQGQSDIAVQVWGQTCGIGAPELTSDGAKKVYKEYYPNSCIWFYSNKNNDTVAQHTYSNGICSVCGTYEPAVVNGDVYEISNAGQLYWFAQQVNEKGNTNIKGKLIQDITIPAQKEWIPIGYSSNKPYGGLFDGNNHTIKGIYIRGSYDNTGLFGYLSTGIIKNIGLINTDILVSKRNVGGVCGFMNTGTISNSYNTGIVSSSDKYVGGVCGYNNTGTISNSYNTGTISGTDGVGGVCGASSYNTAVTTNCYNTGEISGTNWVGGVNGANSGEITNSYNTGIVSGSGGNYIGGVCGNNQVSINNTLGSINNCFYLETNETDSIIGTTCKTSAQFTSGEVAYLLSKGCMIGNITYSGDIWGQNLNISGSYPTLGGAKVYRVKEGTTLIYTNFVLIKYGDLNADGVINDLDYTCLKDYLLGKINSFPAQSFLNGRNVADLNGDGNISSIDAAYLKRYLNGIITKFPVE